MTQTFLYLFAGMLFLLGLGNLFTFILQDYFIFRPQKLQAQYAFDFDHPFESFFLDTPFEGKINVLWFKTPKTKKRRGVMLYFHGNTANLVRWGILHTFFLNLGYDFFVYDYRGFGKSTGPRNEKTMHSDADAMYYFLLKHYSPSEIVLYGRSLGSAFASKVAGDHEARMLILETPFSSMPDLFYSYYPFLPSVFRFKYKFLNHNHLPKVKFPIYIFQGTHDYVVPFRCAIRLNTYLKPDDVFFVIPKGKHGNLMSFDFFKTEITSLLNPDVKNEQEKQA